VKVIGREKIDSFAAKHAKAERPLRHWLKKAEAAKWSHPADIKNTFNSVDRAGPYTIFNIGSNKYRLVTVVVIRNGVLIIERIMTHAEYDKWNKQQR